LGTAPLAGRPDESGAWEEGPGHAGPDSPRAGIQSRVLHLRHRAVPMQDGKPYAGMLRKGLAGQAGARDIIGMGTRSGERGLGWLAQRQACPRGPPGSWGPRRRGGNAAAACGQRTAIMEESTQQAARSARRGARASVMRRSTRRVGRTCGHRLTGRREGRARLEDTVTAGEVSRCSFGDNAIGP